MCVGSLLSAVFLADGWSEDGGVSGEEWKPQNRGDFIRLIVEIDLAWPVEAPTCLSNRHETAPHLVTNHGGTFRGGFALQEENGQQTTIPARNGEHGGSTAPSRAAFHF